MLTVLWQCGLKSSNFFKIQKLILSENKIFRNARLRVTSLLDDCIQNKWPFMLHFLVLFCVILKIKLAGNAMDKIKARFSGKRNHG